MEFVHLAVTVLGFLSVGHSAPVTNCETLIQPIEFQRDQLLGKWIYLAESTDIAGTQLLTKMFFESTWWKLTAAENEDDGLRGVYFSKMAGFCSTFSVNLKLVNNTISAVRPYTMSATLLKTGCPDCIVSLGKHTIGRNMYTSVQLMSRRRRVTDAELNEFKKQAECLNLPSLAILDQEKDLCPDESYNKETVPTEITNATKRHGH
ncbi:hypothetical protein Q5P01_025143 [Channa striata]|uniref:Apolipoprotein M n=1 Tax=Channa striata TaxID=64152 RepID=A0AA88IM14_CHASR|nr:hypothetical protein Q5P01_025143 [Channa striata]